MSSTRALCGEHGLPLSSTPEGIVCSGPSAPGPLTDPNPCLLSFHDLLPEVGESIVVRDGAVFVVWDDAR